VIADHQLQLDVLDELEFEPSVNAAHIGVGAASGVITPTGLSRVTARKLPGSGCRTAGHRRQGPR
jgi:hypothetical protein